MELLLHHNGTNVLVIFKLENFQKKSHSRSMKCELKANNTREAVVVCARHVVKRPSKGMRYIINKLN